MTKTLVCLLSGLILLSIGAARPAEAVVVSTSVGVYDVTTVFGEFDDLMTPTLDSQVWWDNLTLAEEFADAVQDQLGVVSFGNVGPVFATGIDPLFTPVFEGCYFIGGPVNRTACDAYADRDANVYFATAEFLAAVPAPATLPIFAAGLGLVAMARRRARSGSR